MGMFQVLVKRKSQKILQFNPRRDRFEFFSDYEDRFIAKAAGFFWVPEIRAWCTGDRSKAQKLIRYADAESREVLRRKPMAPADDPILAID